MLNLLPALFFFFFIHIRSHLFCNNNMFTFNNSAPISIAHYCFGPVLLRFRVNANENEHTITRNSIGLWNWMGRTKIKECALTLWLFMWRPFLVSKESFHFSNSAINFPNDIEQLSLFNVNCIKSNNAQLNAAMYLWENRHERFNLCACISKMARSMRLLSDWSLRIRCAIQSNNDRNRSACRCKLQ